MEITYKKSQLNISLSTERLYLDLLNFQHNYLVDAKVNNNGLEEIGITYNISNLSQFSSARNLTRIDRLLLLINYQELLNQENELLEWEFTPENMYYDERLNIKFCCRRIRKNLKLNGSCQVGLLKNCVNFLFLDFPYERIINLDQKAYRGNKFLIAVNDCRNEEEIKALLSEELINSRKNLYEKEITINKVQYIARTKKIKRMRIIIFIFTVLIAYFSGYKLPFMYKEINLVNHFQDQNYTQVIKISRTMNPKRLNSREKYYAAYATVKTENLSTNQKDNILVSVSPSTDEKILDYWLYIGLADFERAYSIALSLNDIELQTYALLKELEVLNTDNQMASVKKEEKRGQIKAKIDQNKQVMEQMVREQE